MPRDAHWFPRQFLASWLVACSVWRWVVRELIAQPVSCAISRLSDPFRCQARALLAEKKRLNMVLNSAWFVDFSESGRPYPSLTLSCHAHSAEDRLALRQLVHVSAKTLQNNLKAKSSKLEST